MTKEYTADEVQDVLQEHTWVKEHERSYDRVDGKWQKLDTPEKYLHVHEFSWDDLTEGDTFDTALGVIEVVDLDEGGEGHGEDIHAVVRIVETDQLFRINGRYMSHYGSEWDGPLYPVNAITREVTFYE